MAQMQPLPGETAANFYKRVLAAGETAPQSFKYVPPNPTSTYTTPGGGTVTMPSVLPAQDSGFGSSGQPQSGPISQAVAPAAPATPPGPRIYGLENQNAAQPPPAAFNMGSYLDSKLGASTPRSVTTPLSTATTTVGRGGGGDVSSILDAIAGNFNKANQANESRFNQAKKELKGMGASYRNEIAQNYKQDVARQEQDATRRGLGNTTIRSALLGGARRRQQDASLSLADRLASARVNLLQSKYDNAPDPLQMAQLVAQASQGAYGSGNTLSSIASALGYRS